MNIYNNNFFLLQEFFIALIINDSLQKYKNKMYLIFEILSI